MRLPKGFQFSQGSLQDFFDCRRRFFLRYIQQLAWPAVESEPMLENERFTQQGINFHKMIHQHLIGVPADRLSSFAFKDDLENWWQNYLDLYNRLEFAKQTAIYPEITLSSPMGNHRLIAAFDLIFRQRDNTFVIYDWKTNRRRPPRVWLERRLQTRVYPFLLAKAGGFMMDGKPIPPEQIRMVYWFANFPLEPEIFNYDEKTYHADQKYLAHLVETIEHAAEDNFHLTDDARMCQFCVYRSLCERGIQAGIASDEESMENDIITLDDTFLDFDQIAEIPF
ncbi:MAG: PD-(D/E)XK nuclease family protein [Chloroflexi bacterium]|nr:PD-(D/E)XK nuclease family protein [Chloroflexota bacterium]